MLSFWTLKQTVTTLFKGLKARVDWSNFRTEHGLKTSGVEEWRSLWSLSCFWKLLRTRSEQCPGFIALLGINQPEARCGLDAKVETCYSTKLNSKTEEGRIATSRPRRDWLLILTAYYGLSEQSNIVKIGLLCLCEPTKNCHLSGKQNAGNSIQLSSSQKKLIFPWLDKKFCAWFEEAAVHYCVHNITVVSQPIKMNLIHVLRVSATIIHVHFISVYDIILITNCLLMIKSYIKENTSRVLHLEYIV